MTPEQTGDMLAEEHREPARRVRITDIVCYCYGGPEARAFYPMVVVRAYHESHDANSQSSGWVNGVLLGKLGLPEMVAENVTRVQYGGPDCMPGQWCWVEDTYAPRAMTMLPPDPDLGGEAA